MGQILPVATTERATSPTSALPSCDGSSLSGVESARAANTTPAISTAATAPRMIQSRFRDLREEFNAGLQLLRDGSKLNTQSDSRWFPLLARQAYFRST